MCILGISAFKHAMKLKLALWQIMISSEVVTSLVYILQTRDQFYMMYEKFKNDVSDNVTCREGLFLKVSNWNIFQTWNHSITTLVCSLTALQRGSITHELKCQMEAKFKFNAKRNSGVTTTRLLLMPLKLIKTKLQASSNLCHIYCKIAVVWGFSIIKSPGRPF